MTSSLHRSVEIPIRNALSMDERWSGPDRGLIWCWERGRQKREVEPELATRASNGELIRLVWKRGTFQYLATWQGLRGEDLNIVLDEARVIDCSVSGKSFVFKAGVVSEEELEDEARVAERE